MIYILVIVGVIVLDRIVKIAVTSGMMPGDTIAVAGDFFHITYVRNTGAAFSILEGHTVLLVVFTAVVILLVIVFICARHRSASRMFMLALALICGGGIGNLTDRAAYGYVIDMFDFGFFPVFNVADIGVVAGCGLMILHLIMDSSRSNGQHS